MYLAWTKRDFRAGYEMAYICSCLGSYKAITKQSQSADDSCPIHRKLPLATFSLLRSFSLDILRSFSLDLIVVCLTGHSRKADNGHRNARMGVIHNVCFSDGRARISDRPGTLPAFTRHHVTTCQPLLA